MGLGTGSGEQFRIQGHPGIGRLDRDARQGSRNRNSDIWWYKRGHVRKGPEAKGLCYGYRSEAG